MNSSLDLIILTGCSGRLGTSVMERFIDQPYRIIGLNTTPPRVQAENSAYIYMDISSDESVEQAFEDIRLRYGTKIASFIHFAAYYNFAGGEWKEYEEITIKGTERLLDALQMFEVEQFVFASTMLVRAPQPPPQKINEESPLSSSWEYPRSKVEAEKIVREKHGKIPYVILEIAACYDKGCHCIPIANQIQRIYEKQFASRVFPGNITHGISYLHLDDLAEVVWQVVQNRHTLPPELTMLVGEEDILSYDQIQRRVSRLIFGYEYETYRIPKWFAKFLAWIHQLYDRNSFIKPWMIPLADDNYQLDISRLKHHLNWSPTHSLEETLPIMIQALKSDPIEWYKTNQLHLPTWVKKQAREKTKQ